MEQLAQNIQVVNIPAQSGREGNDTQQMVFIIPQGVWKIPKSHILVRIVSAATQADASGGNIVYAPKNAVLNLLNCVITIDGIVVYNIQNLGSHQLAYYQNKKDKGDDFQVLQQKSDTSITAHRRLHLQKLGDVAGGSAITSYYSIPFSDFFPYLTEGQDKLRILTQGVIQMNIQKPSEVNILYQSKLSESLITYAGLKGASTQFIFRMAMLPQEQNYIDTFRNFVFEQKQTAQSPTFNFSVPSQQILLNRVYIKQATNANHTDIEKTGIGDVSGNSFQMQVNGYNVIQTQDGAVTVSEIEAINQLSKFNKSETNYGCFFGTFDQQFSNSQIQTIINTGGSSANQTHSILYHCVQAI